MTSLEIIAATHKHLVEHGGTIISAMEAVVPDRVWYRRRPQVAVLDSIRMIAGVTYLSTWRATMDDMLAVLDAAAGAHYVS